MPSSMRPPASLLHLRRPFLSRACAVAMLVLICAAVSSCGPELPKFPPICPKVGILADGADLTQFRATGTDLTDMVVDGRITGLSNAKCSLDDLTHLRTVLSVNLDISRGPAARSNEQDVPYYVAVTRGDRILTEQDYVVRAVFPNNSDRLRLTGREIDIVLPVDEKTNGAAYGVTISFRLTPAQLAFNRRRGPR